MHQTRFPGNAGLLEGFLSERGNIAAVLCHPHPLYGGSMHDAVLSVVDRALGENDVTTLRFNFRGVGASEGRHDDGEGEVDDVISACAWLSENRSPEKLLLAGYSFGAVMALRAASRVSCDALLLVAPPVQMLSRRLTIAVPALVVLGEEDSIVDVEQATRCFSSVAQVETVPGADHFFMGADASIMRTVSEFSRNAAEG